ncbi:MAG: tetratricopeptide repeat protein, partial [Candidatus Rokuibacteriota bacterium]
MRSITVSLALTAALAAGCTTGDPPRSTAPTGAVGDPSHGEARAREALELGRAAMARGDMTTAAASFREALRLRPDLVEARERLGLALYELGDLDGSVEELRALLRQHPDAGRARLVLATALMAKQEWSSARRELE